MRTPFALPLALALALGCRTAAPSPEDGAAPPSGVDSDPSGQTDAAHTRTRELDAMLLGRKVGEVVIERAVLQGGGVRLTSRVQLDLQLDDPGENAMHVESEGTDEYGPDLLLRHSIEVSREKDVVEKVEITIANGSLRAHVESLAHEDDRTFGLPSDWSTELAVFTELSKQADAGKPLPLVRRYADFDADDMGFSHKTYKLVGRTRFATPDGEIEAWQVDVLDEKDGDHTRAIVDHDGLPVRTEQGVFIAALRGTAKESDTKTEFSSYLEVDGNFAPSADDLGIDVIVKDDPKDLPDAIPQSPYQRVKRSGDTYTVEMLARRGDGRRAPTLPLRGPSADVARFLKPTPTSQSDAADIVERAKEIVGEEKDSRRAAEAIVNWVHRGLAKSDGVRGAATAVETLAAGKGDCTEHAALAVALARAAGIPARNADGIVLVPGFFGADAGYHAWMEVWVGEWVAMDPALGRTKVGPHYLWFGYDEPGEADGTAAMSRLFGRTKIKVQK